MKFQNFLGSSYVAESPLSDAEDLINWQVQPNLSPGAKGEFFLVPIPGMEEWTDAVNNTETRASFAENGQVFKIIGNGYYEVFENRSLVLRGTLVADSLPGTISSNGDQHFVTSGGHGYCYDLTTHAFTEVLVSGARQGGILTTRFVAFDPDTGIGRFSALDDGTAWDPLDIFERSTTSDPVKGMVVTDYGEILLLGEKTTEPWVPTNDPDDPFAPKGLTIPWGIGATFSVVSDKLATLWLARSKGGAGQVVSMAGYSPRVVSTPALDAELSKYRETSRIDDAEGGSFQMNGRDNYLLSFPTADKSWLLDRKTGFWSPVGSWDSTQARYTRWRASWHCYEWNTHLVGDTSSGKIYRLSSALGLDATGQMIRCVRVTPGIKNDGRRVFFDSLELYLDPKVAWTTVTDPKITLYCSDDGGQTWWSAGDRRVGARNERGLPVIWDSLGSSYDRVFKVVAGPYRIVQAYLRLRGERVAA